VAGFFLVAAVILAYQPAWRAGFIWDDDAYVTQNPLLTAPDGLKRIWLSQDSPSQYFPLVYTTFRIERSLWGLNPAGYHWVNILLHAANALIAWKLLRRLAIPGAWLAAALFALHPVQVESVAWITERKNVLSLFFFLLALLAWVEFARPERGRGRWRFYGLALLCYMLALFSKTVACTLPAALVLILWLKGEPLNRARWAQVSPFVALGLGMGLVTVWWERHHIGTGGGIFAMSLLDRALIATRAIWFYAAKLIWPAQLAFSYPRWLIDPKNPVAYAGLLAAVIFGALLYGFRGRLGRGPGTAALFYGAMLSPMLGFIMLFTFRYTFVADHYQYVAALGPLALLAAGLTVGLRRVRSPMIRWLVPGLILAVLACLTWRQARIYQNVETLWRDTLAKNPESWLAHSNLGQYLLHQGRFEEALDQYQQSLRINPRDVDSLVSIGNALFGRNRPEEAMEYYNRALQVNPDNPEAHVNLAVILAERGELDAAIAHDRQALTANPKLVKAHANLAVALARKGQMDEALEHYRQAIALNPDQPLNRINLAMALESLGRKEEAKEQYQLAAAGVNRYAETLIQQGRLAEAKAQYEEAIRLIPENAAAHCALGKLLLRQGKPVEAAAEFQEALRIKPDLDEAQAGLRETTERRPH